MEGEVPAELMAGAPGRRVHAENRGPRCGAALLVLASQAPALGLCRGQAAPSLLPGLRACPLATALLSPRHPLRPPAQPLGLLSAQVSHWCLSWPTPCASPQLLPAASRKPPGSACCSATPATSLPSTEWGAGVHLGLGLSFLLCSAPLCVLRGEVVNFFPYLGTSNTSWCRTWHTVSCKKTLVG